MVITADTDFPMMLALRRASSPSVVLLRGVSELTPDDHAELIVSNLSSVAAALEAGAIVTITPRVYESEIFPSTDNQVLPPLLDVEQRPRARIKCEHLFTCEVL